MLSDAEYRERLGDADFDRRQANVERRSAEIKNNILQHVRDGVCISNALLLVGQNTDWLNRAVGTDATFRQSLFRLLPSRAMEPRTPFGIWLAQCDRTRQLVGFCGDMHPGDVGAIAQHAESTEWPQNGGTRLLDCLVVGRGGNLIAHLARLKPNGIVLGEGVGPQSLEGWRIEVITLPDARFFRMTR